ncbi:formylglycine-generating enzyme family protein [Thalassorhabdomicrobium marinisediminis]|uniref:Nitrate reductase n=1 Tax=Thalassorhabdomicrobium marinisediminis TaxID=2170577 RepID=A0A2T7FWU4_9RHOB|nr:SUMF1/EgtB/PvdO family nonheme iron enzyme [Thalassorhabdomicrobium marinisediminis]PVA06636.1 nitrate reductase [Thalassorhabdomicrobium marinisediminis]
MTFAIATEQGSPISLRVRLISSVAVALLVGVAFIPRDPDIFYAPQMAERPVILPDGARLYVQKYEVTVTEWNRCHADGACTLALQVPANRDATTQPATGLSYTDVSEYLRWINAQSDATFRLPSLHEWEFMAAPVLPPEPDPIFTDPELTWASAYLVEPQTKRTLRPQGSFATTNEGIVDLNGSVWEWTQDCYAGASDGEITPDRCPAFFVGGEHVAAMSYLVRDPARGGCAVGTPPAHLGLRLVSDRPVN